MHNSRLPNRQNAVIIALCLSVAACGVEDSPIEPSTTGPALARSAVAAYTFVDLGTLPGGCCQSLASDINARGQVVGTSNAIVRPEEGEDAEAHPFLWQNGVMTDLNVGDFLGGDLISASGINSSGAVTVTAEGGGVVFAYVWKQGVFTRLRGLGDAQAAAGINARGEVVGTDFRTDINQPHAMVWDKKGAIHDLGTLGGRFSNGVGINDAGDVVGTSSTSDLKQHAFLWSKGAMTDLGTLGGDLSFAHAINSAGAVAGCSTLEPGSFVQHAFVWQKGVMTDLGTLGGVSSCASDLDGAGRIVGQAATSAGVSHAVLWDDGVIIDLGALAGEGESGAAAINSQGTVVGFYQPSPPLLSTHAAMWVRE
jgi:probable HAF family extracellular repeat protein